MKQRTQAKWDSAYMIPYKFWTYFRIYFKSEYRGTGFYGSPKVEGSWFIVAIWKALKLSVIGIRRVT